MKALTQEQIKAIAEQIAVDSGSIGTKLTTNCCISQT